VESTLAFYEELRSTLTTQLNCIKSVLRFSEPEDLSQAVKIILETARQSRKMLIQVGLVLFSPDNKIEIELGIDAKAYITALSHPLNFNSTGL